MSVREILFRGKRVDTGEWVQGFYFLGRDSKRAMICSETDNVFRVVDEKTVGQYTGLTDQNGKRIFEGDMVQIDNEIFVVKWMNGFACFGLRHPANMRTAPPITSNSVKRMQVIGNIHDDPELLDGGRKT